MSTLYDKAEWHSGGDFPADLPPEAGATHIGMFFAWAALRGLAGDLHTTEFPEDLAQVTARSLPPGEAARRMLDGRLTDEDLSDEGNAFAAAYYVGQTYYADLGRVCDALPSVYHLPDTWGSFDRLAPMIDERFRRWKKPSLLDRIFRRD